MRKYNVKLKYIVFVVSSIIAISLFSWLGLQSHAGIHAFNINVTNVAQNSLSNGTTACLNNAPQGKYQFTEVVEPAHNSKMCSKATLIVKKYHIYTNNAHINVTAGSTLTSDKHLLITDNDGHFVKQLNIGQHANVKVNPASINNKTIIAVKKLAHNQLFEK